MLIRRIISSSLHLKMKANVMPIVLQSKPFHAVGEHGHITIPWGYISCMLASQRSGCESCAQEEEAKKQAASVPRMLVLTLSGRLRALLLEFNMARKNALWGGCKKRAASNAISDAKLCMSVCAR